MLTHAAELARLREENEGLKDRVAYLEETLKPTEMRLPGKTQLSFCELKVMRRLLMTTPNYAVTKEQIYRALYLYEDEVEMKIVDVFVCKIRKKLAAYGIAITTIWGRGYTLDPASHAALKAMIIPPESANPSSIGRAA